MKIRNILPAGLLLMGFSACNDFLDVDPPSKFDNDYVYSDKNEINRALNGVYAQLMSSNMYGNNYMGTFCLNSDVDISVSSNELSTTNSYRRFDCTSQGSELNSLWNIAYQGVEYANYFVYNLENSELFDTEDAEIMQMLGEAKVIRAMFYHDLIVMFGDIPFSFIPTYVAEQSGYEDGKAEKFLPPVTDREEIHKKLIEDLKAIAPYMLFARDLTDGVERVSKEFCWSMIARMALTCGGYSLRPDPNDPSSYGKMERPDNYRSYYEITRQYCDSVISSGTHALNLPYNEVFIDECNYEVNNSDDPIFEIPFVKNVSGRVGYLQGPTGESYEGETAGLNIWGGSNGGARLNAFYRFSFDPEDLRRDFVNGLWYYRYDGTPVIRRDYYVHNNKWSKFWQTPGNAMGIRSTDNTGINYPYMRYTDVLLMYAEAVNELENGVGGANGVNAIAALREVRNRAFVNPAKVDGYIASVSGSKEDFLKAILNERKWEFAGENMRWKDLVRNNMYSEIVYYSFLRYYCVAENAGGFSVYMDDVIEYDGNISFTGDGRGYLETLPSMVDYRIVSNPGNVNVYPNTILDILEIYNSYYAERATTSGWDSADFYAWWSSDGHPDERCLYSFFGFIQGDRQGNIWQIDNHGQKAPFTFPLPNPASLPPVRYILPYPSAAIQRSAGEYKNYYGYN